MNPIRQIRESKEISQKELARRANVCQGLLCNLEKERLKPWPSVLKKLARALKVKPSELQSTNKADTAKIVEAPAVSIIDILPHCKLYFQRLLLNSGNAFMIAAHPDIAIAEKLEPVAAVTLGVIHSGIGFLSQRFQILGILGVYGDTYACG